ncbi:hypothetical protein hairong_095 [Pseudomonas phage hairong]|nr:hypothetical protein hairong_095 [Pseudomonas phage hairong]
MSHHFELEDVPNYLGRFPVLKDKAVIAQGEYSVIFEGTRPDTVLKLTCDHISASFARQHGSPTFCPVLEYHGQMDSADHGPVVLLELPRLRELSWDADRKMFMERDMVMAAAKFLIAESEQFNGIVDCQQCHASALEDLADSGIVSSSVRQGLNTLAVWLRRTAHDVMVDICNPNNFMTDGKHLIITDPINPVL